MYYCDADGNQSVLEELFRNQVFGELFLESAGREREKGESLYEGFCRYREMAKPSPGKYREQLVYALTLVQRLGELYGNS